MENLSKQDYVILTQLVSMREMTLLKTMSAFLKSSYGKDAVITSKDFIYAQGNIPVCLVAHLDTVFRLPVVDIFYDRQKNVIWSPDGLGSDDRAGVFAIMDVIEDGYRPSILFTTKEESGALGAMAFCIAYPNPIDPNIKFIIELDRQGSHDCAFYDCDNKDFIAFIESFGYQSTKGSFSDISEICPEWEIAGVNLSIGYKNEHSEGEYLNVTWMQRSIEKVKKILDFVINNEVPKFQYIPSQESIYYSNKYFKELCEKDYHFGLSKVAALNLTNEKNKKIPKYDCIGCNYDFIIDAVIPVKDDFTGETVYLCIDCFKDFGGWCSNCGKAFLTLDSHNLCPACKMKEELAAND